MDEKTLDAENEIQISADLKKLPESLQKGETPIDLKLFYIGEDQHFKNRLEMQDLDSSKEKFANLLSVPELAGITKEKKISIYLETGIIYLANKFSHATRLWQETFENKINLWWKLQFLLFWISNIKKCGRWQ